MPVELPTETPFLVTTKFEKYGTYTIMARSKEHAISKYENGEWDFDDYESDYGEYNERIYEVEEQDIFDQKQLVLEGVLS
tara:strand:- start:500 stop:739 length:240 start_codon:yes stop_codon:yes gene_type:complete